MSLEVRRGEFTITTDPACIDVAAVHAFLARSYWAAGIPRDVVQRSIDNALCFALRHGEKQIGFARVVTDRATFAYLADVYVLEEFRSRGLATWLMQVIVAHPDLQGLRRWHLVTRDAHALYAKFGFVPLAEPERHMQRVAADIYRAGARAPLGDGA